MTLQSVRDWRGVASPRHKNCAEIVNLVYEQKHCPVRFSRLRKAIWYNVNKALSNDHATASTTAKNNSALYKQLRKCITLFCTFLCRHCTTTTWKCLISRFVEDVNTRQWLSFSFPELWCSLLEFNSRKISRCLTKWTRWNNAIKFETARILFFSDEAVAVVEA